MPITAGELIVKIGADASGAVETLRGAMGTIGSIGQMALGVFAGNLITNAISSVGGLAREGINAVGSYERLSATLRTMVRRDIESTGGSMDDLAGKTRELLGWVQQLARESPFDAEGVAVALRTAMAYGFTAEEAKRITQATIDFAAGSGQSTEAMNSIALALGQIKAKGKLAGQEMLQLVNAGIDVRAALVETLGKTPEEIARMMDAGTIDAQTAINAIINTLTDDFGGAAKEQTSTVQGLLSTFDELRTRGLRELFSGLVDAVRPLADTFLSWLQSEGMDKLRNVGQYLGEMTQRAIDFTANAKTMIDNVFEWIRQHGAEVGGALTGIAVALGAFAAISAIAGILSAITNPLGLIIMLVGLLGAAWAGNWGGIRDKLIEVWNEVRPHLDNITIWVGENVPNAIEWLRTKWEEAWGKIQGVVDTVAPIIKDVIAGFQSAVEGDWYAFGEHLRDAWDKEWGLIKDGVGKVLESIKTVITETDWGEVGKQIILGIADGIKKSVDFVKNAARDAANAAVNAVKGFLRIKSPSQVFIDIGYRIMQGWQRGIETQIPRLTGTVQSAAASVVKAPQLATQHAGGLTINGLNINFRDTDLTPETLSTALRQLEWLYL